MTYDLEEISDAGGWHLHGEVRVDPVHDFTLNHELDIRRLGGEVVKEETQLVLRQDEGLAHLLGPSVNPVGVCDALVGHHRRTVDESQIALGRAVKIQQLLTRFKISR